MAAAMRGAAQDELSIAEAVKLGAADTSFYGHFFFPKAFRQKSPPFHREIDGVLENPKNRYVGIMVFRGGSKTTKLRIFTSKRIAYGISHTVLYVSASQDHAIRSVTWLRKQVEFNKVWRQTFSLEKGDKWTDSEIEIRHGVDEYPIRVIGVGITGQTRGINIDDYRPDLIVVDDPCDEENTATPEQREKTANLFFGALAKSLAPTSECPDAKMVLLQTVLNQEDLISSCVRDPQWATAVFGCFDDRGQSRWPERWSTKELLAEKDAHIARNQLSLWMREMECKIVSPELSLWRQEWLGYWDVLPEGMPTYIGIDPTPPPKETEAAKNLKLDDAAIVAIGLHGGKVYLLEYYMTKSPNPEEFIAKIFEFVIRYRPLKVGFESLLFARTTKFYIEKEMSRRGHFFVITPVEDRRKKSVRIAQAVSGRASARNLVVHRSHREFIEQFTAYPNVNHDDILDGFAIALELVNPRVEADILEGEWERLEEGEKALPDLGNWRTAP